ncbi:MAG: hypothetical protein K0S48_1225 [Ramlibacter sp.]|nr:hypothetical protein [Ramlibacter sp.]
MFWAVRSGTITVRRLRSFTPRSTTAVTRIGSSTPPAWTLTRSPGRTPRSCASSLPMIASPGPSRGTPATTLLRRPTMRS